MMIRATLLSIGLFLSAGAALANDAPASDASIRELLDITNARSLLEGMQGQMDGLLNSVMQQASQGRPQTPEVQAILDRMQKKLIAVSADSLKWEKLEPLYLRTYSASFTQDELDGLIALYKTPSGQIMIKKMPVVMQHIMAEMPGMMSPMLERIKVVQAETLQEFKALSDKQQKKSK
jgi:hypothetical protein